jgi:CRISPR/Cas system CSM-associated protein Csm4 (group 5 of RAMP superfamily)
MGSEMSEEDKVNSHVSKIMDEIFSESKVDKVLTSYFNISESEKKEKKQKINEGKKVEINSIKQLSETIEQELAAEFIIRENSNYKFVGKTNKSNLVFEHNGEQIRVTPKGEVL